MRRCQDLREPVLDCEVAQMSHALSAGGSRKVANSMGPIQRPGQLSKGFGIPTDGRGRLSLRIQDSVQPVLDDLLSKLPVPTDVDRINDHAEAPKIARRKQVQQRFVVVSTRTYIESQGVRRRTYRARAR